VGAAQTAGGISAIARSKSAQKISAREAAALVRSGDWLDYGAVSRSPTCSTKRWRSERVS
jgi:hypothetical protein